MPRLTREIHHKVQWLLASHELIIRVIAESCSTNIIIHCAGHTRSVYTHSSLPSPVSPHSWEDLQTRVTNVTKSANDAINDKHNTQEHKSCNNWHEESQTHAVNSIHWVVWTLSCVYYCQGENTPGMRPHSCQLYSTMSSGHVTAGEERSWCAEVSVLWGLTRLLVTMAGVSWGPLSHAASPADNNNYCYSQ